MRTRLNLQAISDEQTRVACEMMLFGNQADLKSYVRKVRIPEDAKRLKRAILNYQELSIALPEGEPKKCIDVHLANLMSAGQFAGEKKDIPLARLWLKKGGLAEADAPNERSALKPI
jgi:hypothetical protein